MDSTRTRPEAVTPRRPRETGSHHPRTESTTPATKGRGRPLPGREPESQGCARSFDRESSPRRSHPALLEPFQLLLREDRLDALAGIERRLEHLLARSGDLVVGFAVRPGIERGGH